MKKNKRLGISIIILVIAIIVMIILAGVIVLNTSKSNVIKRALESNFKTNLSQYNNELMMNLSSKFLQVQEEFNLNSVNTFTNNEIREYIKNIPEKDINKYKIINGKLAYIGSDLNEIKWSKEKGVSLDIPYIKDGLVLWYDGIYNKGIGIYNDNNNVWKDLSGNGNDMTISNIDFTISDGWNGKGLSLDNTQHTMNSNNPLKNQTLMEQGYTIEVVFQKKSIGIRRYLGGINRGFHINYYNEKALHYINDGNSDHYAYSNNASEVNKILSYTGTYFKDSVSTKVEMYANGADKNNGSYYGSLIIPYGMESSITYYFNDAIIYSVRIYDKVLTQKEITRNYQMDKGRFGI
ncbi:MAG: hypothetical protein PHR25_05470 [Clostridia bacterium]|nr:hypothetical protein [Clostridia bacterium]MDD4376214.1 hypothetical protein [Clostridia bacterium]